MSATFVPFPRDALDRSIPDRFADQVARYPDRIAICAREESITYRQLGRAVERIARAVLTRCGPAAEPVALLFDQGASLVTAALGVLATGKYYVPLDPMHPHAHLLAMLGDLRPSLILTDHRHREVASRLVPDCGRILAVDEVESAAITTAPLPRVAPDALAYIFYTSGSTGRAKGVMDTHRNVLHNIMRYTNSLRIRADDRFTCVLPASSSGAVSDMFGALLTGAALFPVDLHHEDLAGLATWINREHLTIYHSAPAIFRHIAQSADALPSLRVIRLEGDTASPRDVDLFRTRCAADSILVNGLGLTECGLVRQYFVARSTPVDAPVPVGYAVEDMTVAVIDATGREVPAGTIGEIVVESRFLAQGYWGQPDLTAERFSTVLDQPEVRRYRTGDLGRLRPDGCLLHLGRIDFQPKVRGHRIDTEAIEAALLELSTVSEAAVVVRADGPDDPRLVAYCVASGTPPPTVSALRRHLTERLPRDLLPASYVWLPRLPLTDNGKVDRRVLPAPGRARPPLDTVMVAPRSTVETALAQLWAEVLGLDEVGVDDDFFDLGGDSLQATQLVGRIRARFGVELGVPALFAGPTVGSVAVTIAAEPAAMGARNANAAIPRCDVPGPFPLSLLQESLLFLCQLDPGEPVYNAPLAMRLRGHLAVDALGDALDAVVARHEPLRTTIQLFDGVPWQQVEPIRPVDLTRVDLTAIPDASRTAELQRRLRDEVRRPFDLGRDPMLRAHLFRLAANEHVLLLVVHHIATDGWSEGVFIADLSALYEAARRGEPLQLPALPIRYADYVAWQRACLTGELRATQLDYWRRRLADAPGSLDLPHDGPQRMSGSAAGATESMYLPSALVDALLRTSHEVGATLFMTLLAAFKAVLQRHTGRDDIVIGTAISGRTQLETEGLVGFFVNTLALRTDLSGDPTFRELVARVRETSLGAYAHQDLPFASLIAELNPQRQSGRLPLVQVAFVFEPPLPPFAPASLASEQLEVHTGAAPFELTLFVEVVPAGLRATAEYRTALYDASTIVRLLSHWRNVLEAIVADPKQRIGDLPLLNELERHRLLVEWNDTTADYPRDRCIHQLFEEQVKRTPDALAVEGGGRSVSYHELNARAEQLAERLRADGVRSGSLVAIFLERSIEMVVAVLGAWKAGGAYVPIDPGYPSERVRFMLEDTQALMVLTQQSLAAALPAAGAAVLHVDGEAGRVAWNSRRRAPCPAMSPEQLAYVIYTSGSTGRPKGVPITHRSLSNLMCWHQQAYEVTPADRATQIAAPAFDASVWEIWPYLTAGASVHIPDEATRLDPRRLVRWLIEQRITLTFLPTPIAEAALREKWPLTSALRVLLTGGDKLNKPPTHKLPFRLVNHYGPTENAVVSTCAEVSTQDASHNAPPIGRPLPNTRAYVLDSHLQPVPIGVPGELLLGGVQIASGYWNRPELTAEIFVPDPFSAEVGARLYRTGDLARYLPDGNIEYLGRIDDQVKIRGFRIELGEIETVLAEHPTVHRAVVIVREGTAGDKRLVAYVVPVDASLTDIEPLRAFLRERLPEYMRPAAYVMLERLPLTPNGKIDRKALPAPDAAAYASRAYELPVGEIETALAQIWAEVLKLDRIGRHDHFFELGGHSLLAVGMIERMRQAGLHADVRTLFITPTLAELAAAVGGGGGMVEVPPSRIPSGCAAITPEMLPLVQLTSDDIQHIADAAPGGAANIQDIYPLAPLQEGILFHHLMATEGDPYLLSALFGFDSRARLQRYLEALQAVIDRHDILRTSVWWEGLPEPVQVVWRQAPLDVEEVSIAPTEGDVAQQMRARFDPRHYRLDMRQAPLMRVFIAQDAPNARWVMLQLFHHLSTDHVAQEVVQQEIQAHLLGQADRLPTPLPFRNFVVQARLGVSREEHEAFFQKMLGDVDEPTTPFGLTGVHGDGASIAEARRRVDASLARRLRERARALGVSAASVCHLAWAQVLARVSGRDDVVFGTVLLGRMQGGSGADRVLGLFINTLPVRLRVGDAGVQDSVRHTHALLGQLLHHEHAPLALAQRCSAVAAPAPLFSALLNYRHSVAAAHVPAEALQVQDGIESLGGESRTHYPLTLAVDDLGDGFALKVQVQSSIDPQRVCAFMHTALEQLVGALESAPTTSLRNLDVLPETERHQLLVEWNDTAVDYPRDQCIHQLFEQQVERTPEAMAVVFEDSQLTYAELNARANQLAHHLRTLGVGPEVLVGICVERSLELVIGLLGILKAGGAYVPLDPSYPAQRLAFMLEDTQAPVLLTQERLLGQLPTHAGRTLCLDRDWPTLAAQPASNPPATATASNLAYVIYTSGSTGTPKGVMIEHRGVCKHLHGFAQRYSVLPDDRVLQTAPIGFDLSLWQMLLPLIAGARIVLPEPGAHRSGDELVALIRHARVTVLRMVPSMLSAIMNTQGFAQCTSLRMVISAGEVLDAGLARHFTALSDAELCNAYGPTETTFFASLWTCRRDDARATVSIGHPIANKRIYVLDEHRQPVPIGVAGELYIGGEGVARGYLGQPELTAERFVPDPFALDADARMYRTGDRARYLPDGNIEFLGRLDTQVKLRGFRIELGEIEAVLARQPQVRKAVVLLREDVPGDPRLVAYVVPRGEALVAADLRAALKQQLPDYMVPAAFVLLPALPLTPNGKVDRSALPAPAYASSEPVQAPPRTPMERALAKAMAEVLNQDRVGLNDNFFDLGGHSLLAVQLMNRIRHDLNIDLSLRQLFATPTVSGLALAALDNPAAGATDRPLSPRA